MLRAVAVAGLLVALGAGCAAPQESADTEPAPPATSLGSWVMFASVEDLVAESELVVIGTAGDLVDRVEFTEVDDLTNETVLAMAYNLYEFTVERVLVAPPSELPFRFRGVRVGLADFGAPSENAMGFAPGDRVLLFLALFEFEGVEVGWVPLSSDTGILDVVGDRVVAKGTVGPTASLNMDISEVEAIIARVIDERRSAGGEGEEIPSTSVEPSDRPAQWYAVTEAGDVLTVGANQTPVTLVSQGELGRVIGVQRAGERLLLNLCCEPAEGTIAVLDVASGSLEPIPGFGRAEGADASGRWLRVLTNGHQVIVEGSTDGDVIGTASSPILLLGEAALDVQASTVAVVGLDAQESRLYALDPVDLSSIEAGVLVAAGPETGIGPTLPAIDALGRVWYVLEDRSALIARQGVIASAATGDVVGRFDYPMDVVDQNFDSTGYWLLITYPDGTVGWRSLTGETGVFEIDEVVAADW